MIVTVRNCVRNISIYNIDIYNTMCVCVCCMHTHVCVVKMCSVTVSMFDRTTANSRGLGEDKGLVSVGVHQPAPGYLASVAMLHGDTNISPTPSPH